MSCYGCQLQDFEDILNCILVFLTPVVLQLPVDDMSVCLPAGLGSAKGFAGTAGKPAWLENIGRPGCPIVSLQFRRNHHVHTACAAQTLPSAVMQATPYQLSLLKTRLAVVDDALKNQGFIVGDKFSAADIQLVYALCIAQVSNIHDCWHVRAAVFSHHRRHACQLACAAQRQIRSAHVAL